MAKDETKPKEEQAEERLVYNKDNPWLRELAEIEKDGEVYQGYGEDDDYLATHTSDGECSE